MRLFSKLSGGREQSSRAIPSREARASTLPPGSTSLALDAAIDAADLIRREPDEDGERIAVLCNALGGAFVYSREEAERRIMKHFPRLAFEGVAAAARHLENRIRALLKPIQHENRRRSSWTHGWRD